MNRRPRKPLTDEQRAKGRRVAAFRLATGLTQSAMAVELGVEKSSAARWEAGEVSMSPEKIAAFADKHGFDKHVQFWVAFGGAVPRRLERSYAEAIEQAEQAAKRATRMKRAAGAEARR